VGEGEGADVKNSSLGTDDCLRQGPVEFPGRSPIQLAKDDSLCEWDGWDDKRDE